MSEDQKPPSQVPPVQADFSQPPQYAKPASTNKLIPIANPRALVAYYLAIFSLVPGFCLLLGPGAIIYGFLGLREFNQNPQIGGKFHAWIGIILGGFTTLAAVVTTGLIMMNLK